MERERERERERKFVRFLKKFDDCYVKEKEKE